MGFLRTLCATLILLATTFTVAPNAVASGCWYEDAFVTDQEVVGVGDTAAYLVIQQAGYSETCDRGDAQPYTDRCLGIGTDEDDYTTPAITVPEIRVLGQVIVPEQEVVPAQTIPVPADPTLTIVEDPVCTTFAGEFYQVAVGVRIEDGGDETTVRSDGVVLIVKDALFPECFTDEAAGESICYTEDYILIRGVGVIPA